MDPAHVCEQISEDPENLDMVAYKFKTNYAYVIVRIDAHYAMLQGAVFNQMKDTKCVLCEQWIPPEAILNAIGIHSRRIIYNRSHPPRQSSVVLKSADVVKSEAEVKTLQMKAWQKRLVKPREVSMLCVPEDAPLPDNGVAGGNSWHEVVTAKGCSEEEPDWGGESDQNSEMEDEPVARGNPAQSSSVHLVPVRVVRLTPVLEAETVCPVCYHQYSTGFLHCPKCGRDNPNPLVADHVLREATNLELNMVKG